MTESNTQSKLGHSTATANQANQAGAQSFSGSSEGNPSVSDLLYGPGTPVTLPLTSVLYQSIQGASNPSIGGGQKHADGPAQEIAGTLPTDFSLKGMKVSCCDRAIFQDTG